MKSLAKRALIEVDRLKANLRTADIAVFHQFVPPPYGGGNQFLHALWKELSRRGWRLEKNAIPPAARACLFNAFNFDFDRLQRFRRDGCRMIHRVDGPVGVYRGQDDGTDRRVWEMNQALADATIFQSEYSLARHLDLGMTFNVPTVIHNAVDPEIFSPPAHRPPLAGRRTRLIATSWSANPNKGADVYAWLDEHLDWERFEFTFVGRCATAFTRIHVIPPVPSNEVARLLREHDIFLTASRHESCSNALLEALNCGLPAIYHDSGSNGELAGDAGLPFTDAPHIPALLDRMVAEIDDRRARIRVASLAETADRYLQVMALPPAPAVR